MKKVLIMEDEVNIRSFVVINLKRAGFEAIEAGDGQEALDRIAEHPDIGVAILDTASRINKSLVGKDVEACLTIRKIPSQFIQSHRSKAIERLVVEDQVDILVQVTKSLAGIEEIKRRTGVKAILASHGEPFWQRYAITNRRQSGPVRQLLWHLYNKRRFADGTLAMKMAQERTLREYNSSDAFVVLCEAYKREIESSLGIEPSGSHMYAIENMERVVESPNFEKEKMRSGR